MIKAVIFDFDGVIVESAEIKTNAFRKLFEGGYPDKVGAIVDYHSRNAGISRFVKFKYIYDCILKEPLSPLLEQELGNRFSGFVFDEVLKAPFVPGTMKFLAEGGRRYGLFIASGTPEEELCDILRLRGLGRFFKEAHGAPGQKDGIISAILKKHSIDRDEAVFVGDAANDLCASEIAGIAFIARIRSDNEKELKRCKWKIRDMNELVGILEKMEKRRPT